MYDYEKINKIEDVFSDKTLAWFDKMENRFLNHRDVSHKKDYVVFIERNSQSQITDVVVALVKGTQSKSDIKARLFFRLGNMRKFSVEFNYEEQALDGEELEMARQDKLDFYIIDRLILTGLLRPTFGDHFKVNEIPMETIGQA